MRFTIFGGCGFIGENLAAYLTELGHSVYLPGRSEESFNGINLGHVIYAVGLTGDFRTRPTETIEAHVCKLSRLLSSTCFESWLYLSSTRIYGYLPPEQRVNESTAISTVPSADTLYDISKLLGESICLAHSNHQVRVVRLANVYGVGQSTHTFLGSVIKDIHLSGAVTINEAPESVKDYIYLHDVLALLEKIALRGEARLYNLASGEQMSHRNLVDLINKHVSCSIEFSNRARLRLFPHIDISRIINEFKYVPSSLFDHIKMLLDHSAPTINGSRHND